MLLTYLECPTIFTMALVAHKWDQYMNARAQGFVEFAKAFHDKGCLFRHNPADILHRLDQLLPVETCCNAKEGIALPDTIVIWRKPSLQKARINRCIQGGREASKCVGRCVECRSQHRQRLCSQRVLSLAGLALDQRSAV